MKGDESAVSKSYKICTMDEDIRDCSYLNPDKRRCDAQSTKCAYQMDENAKETYVREPRWYEKYYK